MESQTTHHPKLAQSLEEEARSLEASAAHYLDEIAQFYAVCAALYRSLSRFHDQLEDGRHLNPAYKANVRQAYRQTLEDALGQVRSNSQPPARELAEMLAEELVAL